MVGNAPPNNNGPSLSESAGGNGNRPVLLLAPLSSMQCAVSFRSTWSKSQAILMLAVTSAGLFDQSSDKLMPAAASSSFNSISILRKWNSSNAVPNSLKLSQIATGHSV
jgi:hypothetical protein